MRIIIIMTIRKSVQQKTKQNNNKKRKKKRGKKWWNNRKKNGSFNNKWIGEQKNRWFHKMGKKCKIFIHRKGRKKKEKKKKKHWMKFWSPRYLVHLSVIVVCISAWSDKIHQIGAQIYWKHSAAKTIVYTLRPRSSTNRHITIDKTERRTTTKKSSRKWIVCDAALRCAVLFSACIIFNRSECRRVYFGRLTDLCVCSLSLLLIFKNLSSDERKRVTFRSFWTQKKDMKQDSFIHRVHINR